MMARPSVPRQPSTQIVISDDDDGTPQPQAIEPALLPATPEPESSHRGRGSGSGSGKRNRDDTQDFFTLVGEKFQLIERNKQLIKENAKLQTEHIKNLSDIAVQVSCSSCSSRSFE